MAVLLRGPSSSFSPSTSLSNSFCMPALDLCKSCCKSRMCCAAGRAPLLPARNPKPRALPRPSPPAALPQSAAGAVRRVAPKAEAPKPTRDFVALICVE
eukprot:CAMPEP_0177259770 /NCGR_PEP_ID=MMETSP0367-20130122/58840_1 /TAXON_ID=447022 ORGANISM="Scrippsiella hangoei-like, Strain SHHI-4" /NCGR_SAMPLE_ID=MMETSP0367 /ASSEMBLY_ACC=CAM_ASM_000362 /LENGTH=98 /DNA_ID=CAMNT_0018714119 /DNA_START=66 /DNA_END=362 /DNA_ORIENTATION=+